MLDMLMFSYRYEHLEGTPRPLWQLLPRAWGFVFSRAFLICVCSFVATSLFYGYIINTKLSFSISVGYRAEPLSGCIEVLLP